MRGLYPKICNVIFSLQYSLMVILQEHVNTTTIQQPGAKYLLITNIKYLYIFQNHKHINWSKSFHCSWISNINIFECETWTINLFFRLHLTISGYKQWESWRIFFTVYIPIIDRNALVRVQRVYKPQIFETSTSAPADFEVFSTMCIR